MSRFLPPTLLRQGLFLAVFCPGLTGQQASGWFSPLCLLAHLRSADYRWDREPPAMVPWTELRTAAFCSNSSALWAMSPAPTGVLTGRRSQGTSIHPGESGEDTEGRWPHASSRKRTQKNCLSLRSPSFYSSEKNACLSHLVWLISLQDIVPL